MSRLLTLTGGRASVLSRYSILRLVAGARFASTAPANDDKKKYSATLLLPKTPMQLRAKGPLKIEDRLRDRTTHELYKEQYKKNEGDIFILHDGPPYANGNLHMGHALNKILKDMINRYNVIRGRKVHYVPGWDCHGLPIEHKALQALGKSHTALDPVSVRQEARKFALEAIDVQKAEMKLLGVMADWDGEGGVYRTLDPAFEIRQLRLFQQMVKKGFITHRHRPTYYSPSSRTALAEAELEYADLKSTSVYVAFPVEDGDASPRLAEALARGREAAPDAKLHLAIWTTTPWSLPGNMGVTVGEEIDYAVVLNEKGQLLVIAEPAGREEDLQKHLGELTVVDRLSGAELVGTKYCHVFHPASAKGPRPSVFAAPCVTADSGTGLVHSAPAHGHDDYDAFQAAGLSLAELRCPIDDDGKFTPELVGWAGADAEGLVGQAALGEGSRAMIDFIREQGALLATDRISHRYPCDWRTKQPIMVRATPQWFADVESLKGDAEAAMERIAFVPPIGRNRLSATVMSRSEWCISRQRSWGVPIPALFTADGAPVLSEESLAHIIAVLEEKGIDYWWSGPVEEFVPPSLQGQKLTKGLDTLDVWFDSGTSWTLLKDARLRDDSEPLADVYLEGSDQHRGWFQSSFLTRLADLQGEGPPAAPYRTLITHGFTTDEAGNKMSKSLGNGISPMDIVKGTKATAAHGSDTLRVWTAGVDYTRDCSIGPNTISMASELLRKLRSALRFMVGNVANTAVEEKPLLLDQVALSPMDEYVLAELEVLERTAREAYDEYTFNKVLQHASAFASQTLSSLYFDVVKDTLYCDPVSSPERQAIVATMQHVLNVLVKIVAPITPHLAEEVWEALGRTGSVFMSHWEPGSAEHARFNGDEVRPLLVLRGEILRLLEAARRDKLIAKPTEAAVVLNTSDAGVLKHHALLPALFGVSEVRLGSSTGGDSTAEPAWRLGANVAIETRATGTPGTPAGRAGAATAPVEITLLPASRAQCPRCWLQTAAEEGHLCARCAGALAP